MATVNFVRYRSQSRTVLGKVAEYVQRGDKTDGRRYVSGLNCSPLFAVQEFTATRLRHRKCSPVWFYHYTQSFSPEERITPEQAHALAQEFAARAWPESEVLIATHVDARHIHSHFLVNAVCHESGKMLRQGPHTLEHLRRISDELCIRYGFSVLNNIGRSQTEGISAREYRAAEKGQSWKFELMNVIDDCMRRAKTRREFMEQMRQRGYGVRWTRERKSITYTTPTGMKCRDYRLHDKKYLKEAMECEFRIRAEIFYGRIETEEPPDGYGRAGAGDASDGGGMGGVDRAAGAAGKRSGENPESAVRSSGAGAGGNTEADGYPDLGGSGAAEDAATGWEEERAALLSDMAYQNPSAAADMGMAAANPGGGYSGAGVLGNLVRLGKDLERLFADTPVTDATTRPMQRDRKAPRREKEKKIALGHKEDDHEEPRQDYQQHLY